MSQDDKKRSGPEARDEGLSQPAKVNHRLKVLTHEGFGGLWKKLESKEIKPTVLSRRVVYGICGRLSKVTESNMEAAKSFFMLFRELSRKKLAAMSQDQHIYDNVVHCEISGGDFEDYRTTFISKYTAETGTPDEFIRFLTELFPENVYNALQSCEHPIFGSEKAKIRLLENTSEQACDRIGSWYRVKLRKELYKHYIKKIEGVKNIDDLKKLAQHIECVAFIKKIFANAEYVKPVLAKALLRKTVWSLDREGAEGLYYEGNYSEKTYEGCSPLYVDLMESIFRKQHQLNLHRKPSAIEQPIVDDWDPLEDGEIVEAKQANPVSSQMGVVAPLATAEKKKTANIHVPGPSAPSSCPVPVADQNTLQDRHLLTVSQIKSEIKQGKVDALFQHLASFDEEVPDDVQRYLQKQALTDIINAQAAFLSGESKMSQSFESSELDMAMDTILQKYPDAVMYPNEQDVMPINIAIGKKLPAETITKLQQIEERVDCNRKMEELQKKSEQLNRKIAAPNAPGSRFGFEAGMQNRSRGQQAVVEERSSNQARVPITTTDDPLRVAITTVKTH
jgi:hypothetical protein